MHRRSDAAIGSANYLLAKTKATGVVDSLGFRQANDLTKAFESNTDDGAKARISESRVSALEIFLRQQYPRMSFPSRQKKKDSPNDNVP
mmetsp:Transcript_20101/g.48031  ORF Transcript_20101/g.48031 Transcript_20101/m.48031 type:complete len:89 (+) Transcript_20101:663-929(+)